MTKEDFKNTMHDYSNINEYYSYYGSIIHISSSYFNKQDYFLILRSPKAMAVVTITANQLKEFESKTNRKTLIEDLTALEANINWVIPPAFMTHINGLLMNPLFPDKSELIKLKNTDLSLWNNLFVGNMIKLFKIDHTLLSKAITFNQNSRAGVITTMTSADGVYGTMFNLQFDWVTGNPFFDIKIGYFSQVKTRRLYYYDIHELADLLSTMVIKNDKKTLSAVAAFTS